MNTYQQTLKGEGRAPYTDHHPRPSSTDLAGQARSWAPRTPPVNIEEVTLRVIALQQVS